MRTDSPEMTDVETPVTSFASSARAGRRNAVPDIQSPATPGAASDLPLKLQALGVKEGIQEKKEETTQEQSENPQKEENKGS